MEELIGETAGKIYRCLLSDPGKPLPLSQVRRLIGGRTLVFHMAIGWLARENKLSFSARGRAELVALNNTDNVAELL